MIPTDTGFMELLAGIGLAIIDTAVLLMGLAIGFLLMQKGGE